MSDCIISNWQVRKLGPQAKVTLKVTLKRRTRDSKAHISTAYLPPWETECTSSANSLSYAIESQWVSLTPTDRSQERSRTAKLLMASENFYHHRKFLFLHGTPEFVSRLVLTFMIVCNWVIKERTGISARKLWYHLPESCLRGDNTRATTKNKVACYSLL